MGEFATAATTGVPAGTSLTSSGGISTSSDGQIIEDLDVNGTISVNHNNVTIRRCRVRSSGFYCIQEAESNSGTNVIDCEIDGLGNTAGNGGVRASGLIQRCNIHRCENPVSCKEDVEIDTCYIHDLEAPGEGGDVPHYDGTQNDGANNVYIHDCYINVASTGVSTSACMTDNFFGSATNCRIIHNRLIGGGYVVYFDGAFNSNPVSGVLQNNRMALDSHSFGYALIRGTANVTVSGNIDDNTGQALDL